MLDQVIEAAETLVQKAVSECLPEEMPSDPVCGPLWLYVHACLDLCESSLVLLKLGNILSAKVVARSLVEAYARLIWIASDRQQIAERLLQLDAYFVDEYEHALAYAENNAVLVPPEARVNLASKRRNLELRRNELNLKKIPEFPDTRTCSSVAGPSLYFSYKYLSSSAHVSGGVVSDILSLEHISGPTYRSHVATVLESTIQPILSLLEDVGPIIDANRGIVPSAANARRQFIGLLDSLADKPD
jgi:hypothetical protein